jgi:hypothetical protein
MEKIVITNANEMYLPGTEQIDWTKDPEFQFETEIDALQSLEMLGDDLKSAREQIKHLMRYIEAAVSASQATAQDGKVKPQAIIGHTGLARQTVYNMLPKTAADIHPALDRSGENDGWNWAEEATAQWIDAAEKAGLEVEVVSIEVPDVNYDAAIVEVGGEQYVLTVRNDEVTAVPIA